MIFESILMITCIVCILIGWYCSLNFDRFIDKVNDGFKITLLKLSMFLNYVSIVSVILLIVYYFFGRL